MRDQLICEFPVERNGAEEDCGFPAPYKAMFMTEEICVCEKHDSYLAKHGTNLSKRFETDDL